MSELRRAIEEKDVSTVWKLLDETDDVNQPLDETDGPPPLHLAAHLGLSQIVYGLVVVYKADIHVADAEGLTALHHAAAGGKQDVAKYLLDEGAQVDRQDHAGETPLRLALAGEHGELVELLLRREAQPSGADLDGSTLLHEAARHGWAEVVKLLLARDADMPAHSSQPRQHQARNADGDTPLHLAVKAGEAKVVALLVAAGADVWAVNDAGEKPIAMARSRGDDDLKTAIQVGTSRRHVPSAYTFNVKDRSLQRHLPRHRRNPPARLETR